MDKNFFLAAKNIKPNQLFTKKKIYIISVEFFSMFVRSKIKKGKTKLIINDISFIFKKKKNRKPKTATNKNLFVFFFGDVIFFYVFF